MDDPDISPDPCNQPLREFFGALRDESESALRFCVGYPQLIKHIIEIGQSPTNELLIQMADAILEGCRKHREYMDESKPDVSADPCNQLLRECFSTVNMESMRAFSACMGYAQLIKHIIEKGQRPTDEQLIQMMDATLESCRIYRTFMDEVRGDLYP